MDIGILIYSLLSFPKSVFLNSRCLLLSLLISIFRCFGNPVVSNAVWNPAENSEFRLCSAGRLHPAKDFETLIKAFSLYIKENLAFPLPC